MINRLLSSLGNVLVSLYISLIKFLYRPFEFYQCFILLILEDATSDNPYKHNLVIPYIAF